MVTSAGLSGAGFSMTTLGANGSGFGQTSGAYKDLSNTNDPGGRIVEFQLRLTF